ncbi:MAG: integrase, partial [Myxococcota bacterium]
RRMYDTLRRDFYLPFMASYIAHTVRECISCAKMQGTYYAHQKYLQLFPANGPLEFIAIDILGPLPRSKRGNKHVLVITDRYSKLTRTVAMNKITAPHVAEAFLDNWIMPYGIPNALLSDNGP